MSGYNYAAGMSNRAVAAYQDGLSPLSNLTASEMPKGMTLKMAKSLAKKGIWQAAEWHHTGQKKFCGGNETNFYNPAELADLIAERGLDELKKLAADAPADQVNQAVLYAVGRFDKYGRRWEFSIGKVREGTLKGNWIVAADGSKKKADGKLIAWGVVGSGEITHQGDIYDTDVDHLIAALK